LIYKPNSVSRHHRCRDGNHSSGPSLAVGITRSTRES